MGMSILCMHARTCYGKHMTVRYALCLRMHNNYYAQTATIIVYMSIRDHLGLLLLVI